MEDLEQYLEQFNKSVKEFQERIKKEPDDPRRIRTFQVLVKSKVLAKKLLEKIKIENLLPEDMDIYSVDGYDVFEVKHTRTGNIGWIYYLMLKPTVTLLDQTSGKD